MRPIIGRPSNEIYNLYNNFTCNNMGDVMRSPNLPIRDQLQNPNINNDDMQDLWLLIEMSPIDIKSMVWFVMRKSGMLYVDIARAFGVSKQYVHQDINKFENDLKNYEPKLYKKLKGDK